MIQVPTVATRLAYLAGAFALAFLAVYWGTNDELPMDLGTVLILLISAFGFGLSRHKPVRMASLVMLVAVPLVQNAVDLYFTVAVQAKGWPWPWHTAQGATFGSVQQQVGQVATTSFVVLLVFSLLLAFQTYKSVRHGGEA